MSTEFSAMQEWLASYIRDTGAVAGTVHARQGDGLTLAAAVNIPPPVVEAVRWVPWGKGMAGMALESGEAVTTCNLKEDETGRIKPGAKAVAAQAAIALPVKDASGYVTAVVGIAFMEEREILLSEVQRLTELASRLPLCSPATSSATL